MTLAFTYDTTNLLTFGVFLLGLCATSLSVIVAVLFFKYTIRLSHDRSVSKLSHAIFWHLIAETVLGVGTLTFSAAAFLGVLPSWPIEVQSALRVTMFLTMGTTTYLLLRQIRIIYDRDENTLEDMVPQEGLHKLSKLTSDLNLTLIEEEKVLKTLSTATNDGYWDWHMDMDYEYMSPKFWEILGYDHREKEHHPSERQKIIHPEDAEMAIKAFEKHVESRGKEPYRIEIRYKHGLTGKWVNILCRGAVSTWEGDVPLRAVGTHTYLGEEST